MNRIILIALIIVFSAPAASMSADEWSDRDKFLELFSTALRAADWRQTVTISKNPDMYYEKINPILGRHPSTTDVNMWFLTTAIIHPIVTHYLPKKYRPWWQGLFIGMSLYCIGTNLTIGIKMDIPGRRILR